VVDEADRLQGIVSRSDLLRTLRRDEAIREKIDRDVLQRTVGLAPSEVSVEVREDRWRSADPSTSRA
jgi:CBS-domain-containing membrane protein